MPQKGRRYGRSKFTSLNLAYNRYKRDRMSDTGSPRLAPRAKFAQIWGWAGKKKKA